MTSERYVNFVVNGRIEHGRRCTLSDVNEPAVCNVIMEAIRCEARWCICDRLANLSNKLNKSALESSVGDAVPKTLISRVDVI